MQVVPGFWWSRDSGIRRIESQVCQSFKLFNEASLLKVVQQRLCDQLVESRACRAKPNVRLALAGGRVATDKQRVALHALFKKHGWILWDEDELKSRLTALADESYENAVASVVSKILVRKRKKAHASDDTEA